MENADHEGKRAMIDWGDPDLRPVMLSDDEGEIYRSWFNLRDGTVWVEWEDRSIMEWPREEMTEEERSEVQFLTETIKRMELGEFGPGLEEFL